MIVMVPPSFGRTVVIDTPALPPASTMKGGVGATVGVATSSPMSVTSTSVVPEFTSVKMAKFGVRTSRSVAAKAQPAELPELLRELALDPLPGALGVLPPLPLDVALLPALDPGLLTAELSDTPLDVLGLPIISGCRG